MRAQQLLRLYPRAWRARYGDEVAELVGERQLSGQQVIDILAGAVDAWVSPNVRSGLRGSATTAGNGGGNVIQHLKVLCGQTAPRYTVRDGLISAGVLLVASILLVAAGIGASRQGHPDLGEALKSLSFPVAVAISMPFAVMKGQSRRSQVVVIGATLLILIAATYIATKI